MIPISVGHYDEGTWSDNYLWMSIPNPGAPVITSEPQSAAVKAGKQVNLSEADGTDCTYQWQYRWNELDRLYRGKMPRVQITVSR